MLAHPLHSGASLGAGLFFDAGIFGETGRDGGLGFFEANVPVRENLDQALRQEIWFTQIQEGAEETHFGIGQRLHIVPQRLGIGRHHGTVEIVVLPRILRGVVVHAGIENRLYPFTQQRLDVSVR